MSLSIEDRVIKAKISLGVSAPFFASLLMYIEMLETKLIPTMAVDKRGRLYYNVDFVETMSDSQLKCVFCHEIMHIVLKHLSRTHKDWNPTKLNIAADICVNNILVEEGYADLPAGGLIPRNNSIEIPGPKGPIVIDYISKKTTEQIYHLIPDEMANPGFDEHKNPEEDEDDDNEETEERLESEWKQRIAGALAEEKSQGGGRVSGALSESIDKLLNPKIPWRTLLHKYIQQNIIVDYTWRKPSKRSQALGMYLPSNYKESVEILVAIDTSGSIGMEELQMFITETYSILNSYPNVDMRIISGDTELRTSHRMVPGQPINPKDLLVAGGGGNCEHYIFNYVEEEYPDCKLCIFYTDGWTSLDTYWGRPHSFQTLFVSVEEANNNTNGMEKHGVCIETSLKN